MELSTILTNDQVIQLWFHYEEIAMHFNGLIIQYRLQIFGGLGALTGLFSYLLNNKVKGKEASLLYVRAFISTVLLVVFTAAASLDVFYYQQLLSGSVDAILHFESLYPNINMSTLIAEKADSIVVSRVYAMVIIIIAAFTLWSWLIALKANIYFIVIMIIVFIVALLCIWFCCIEDILVTAT